IEPMSSIAMPVPDAAIIAHKPEIVAAMSTVLPADAIVSDPEETQAYECDAFDGVPRSAARRGSASPHQGGSGGDENLPQSAGSGYPARCGDIVGRRRTSDGR